MTRSRIGLISLATVLLLALAACSPGEELAERIIESQEGVGDVEIDEDSGEVSIESDDGSFSIGGGEVPADWPVDIPSGGEVLGVAENADGEGSLSMEFEGGNYDDMVAFFDNWADNSGLEMVSRTEVSNPAGHAWAVQDGERTITVSINDAEDFIGLVVFVVGS